MNYNPLDDEPKELMSDSLQDSFPSEEQQLEELKNIFIVASLAFEDGEDITGNMLGIEFGDNPKLDVKVLTESTFKFIGTTLLTKKNVSSILLIHANEMIKIPGPFRIGSLKIVEMDYENRACVLAIDLFKDCP